MQPFGETLTDLAWIDEFASRVSPYVRVRQEDSVMIKMPTEVFRLNSSGLTLLGRALRGEKIREIAGSLGAAANPERLRQIHTFFCDVRDLLSGHLGDGTNRAGTDVSRYEGSFTKYPVLSEIAVTYRCNQACSFCYAGCGTPDATPGNATSERHPASLRSFKRRPRRDPLGHEMTKEEVFTVIDRIAVDGKVPSVSFTGGECTLRPELPDFIARARERGMRVNIITNGLLCARKDLVRKLVDAGLTSAQVSLEGPDRAIHERLTQRPGSFATTLKGIEQLRDAGLHVHTNTTICEENAEHLFGIIDLARRLSLPHVSMNHVIPTGTPTLAEFANIRISYSRVGEYVLRARDHADQAGIAFHWYSPTPFCIFNPIAHGLGNKGCAACDGLLHVSPSGELLPCSSFARGVGSLLDESFDQVWFGREATWYRKKRQAPALCRTCEHFQLCQGACTLYWSGMGLQELQQANAGRLPGRPAQKIGSIAR